MIKTPSLLYEVGSFRTSCGDPKWLMGLCEAEECRLPAGSSSHLLFQPSKLGWCTSSVGVAGLGIKSHHLGGPAPHPQCCYFPVVPSNRTPWSWCSAPRECGGGVCCRTWSSNFRTDPLNIITLVLAVGWLVEGNPLTLANIHSHKSTHMVSHPHSDSSPVQLFCVS